MLGIRALTSEKDEIEIEMQATNTYKEAWEGTNEDDTEATQVRIREESPKDGQDVGHSRPSVENIGGFSNGHVIIIPQVQYHVGQNPIAWNLFQTLVHWFIIHKNKIKSQPIKK